MRLQRRAFLIIYVIVFHFSCQTDKTNSIATTLGCRLDSCSGFNQILRYNLSMNFILATQSLNRDIIIKNEGDEVVNMSDIFPTIGYRLIFFFSESMCSSCFSQQLDLLNSWENKIPDKFVVLLSSFTSLRKSKVLKIKSNVKYPLYNLGLKSLGLKEIDESKPLYILINSQGQIVSCYFPDYQFPESSNEFLNTIFTRFAIIL